MMFDDQDIFLHQEQHVLLACAVRLDSWALSVFEPFTT